MSFKLGYRTELDGLRAVAVLSVMGVHVITIGSGADLAGKSAGLPPLTSGGMFGVDMFFVLSGFLITSILLHEHSKFGQIDFRAFYIRRILRLSPAMLMLLSACAVYLLLNGGTSGGFDWFSILFSALYISNFALIFWGLRLGMLTQTWSLSVEEQFYSVWPLAVSKLVRLPRRNALRIVAAAAVASWLLRVLLFTTFMKYPAWPLFGSAVHLILAHCDGLLCGALVAMAANWGWLPAARGDRRVEGVSWFCALSLLGVLFFGPGMHKGIADAGDIFFFYYAFVAVATATLIATFLIDPHLTLCKLLRWAPMVWIGKISYGLYLYHMPIFVLTPASALGPNTALIVALAGSIATAAASYFLIERRFLDLRRTLGVPRTAQIVRRPAPSEGAQALARQPRVARVRAKTTVL